MGRKVIHGHARKGQESPEYTAYTHAKERCTNPKHRQWKDYGGRGIKFLFKDFLEFLAALGPKPSPKHVLDRINNDGNYEKRNVRWVPRSESARNCRPRYGGLCRFGHEFTEENTIHSPDGRKTCRACQTDRVYLYRAIKRILIGLKPAQEERLIITLYRDIFGKTPTTSQIESFIQAGVLRKWAEQEQARKEGKTA